jgi:hypothetical protein
MAANIMRLVLTRFLSFPALGYLDDNTNKFIRVTPDQDQYFVEVPLAWEPVEANL